MTSEFKPCPFCGGEQITTATSFASDSIVWVAICKACSASIGDGEDEHEAITAWNTRPAPPAEPVAWRVKDFGDGWTYYRQREAAEREAESTGAVIQGLYAAPPAPAPVEPVVTREEIARLVDPEAFEEVEAAQQLPVFRGRWITVSFTTAEGIQSAYDRADQIIALLEKLK